MFKIIDSALQACQFRQVKNATSPDSAAHCRAQLPPELLKALEEAKGQAEHERQQALADAHAAAASGEGPQPWERDWIEFQVDIEDDIREVADTIGWHRTQDFLEVLDWAMASPQGQRALAEAGDDTNPWQGALELIEELRRPLIEASHQMLRTRAEGLSFTDEAKDDLWDTLEERSLPLYNITRRES